MWNISSVRRHDRHEAEFPEELVSRVIRLFSHKGGMVLDPFVGSGTTAVAAEKLERSCIGIKLNADYAEAAVHRLPLARTIRKDTVFADRRTGVCSFFRRSVPVSRINLLRYSCRVPRGAHLFRDHVGRNTDRVSIWTSQLEPLRSG